MRRRIDTLAKKNGADSYETYIDMISADKAKFKQFINFITIPSISCKFFNIFYTAWV